MAKGVVINVGANTGSGYGHCRGPIFDDGHFKFVHIPWNLNGYGMTSPVPKMYRDMPYADFVNNELRDNYVARSPDFCNCCFASSAGALANKLVHNLSWGEDFLFFYATLDFKGDQSKREKWINPDWGAYIVGYFKVYKVWKRSEILSNEEARKAFQDYDFTKILGRPECFGFYNNEEDGCNKCPDSSCCSHSPGAYGTPNPRAPWIKGIKEHSGLLEKAFPLSSSNDSKEWSTIAIELFRIACGNDERKINPNKDTVFRSVLTVKEERLERLLEVWTLQRS